MNEGGKKSSTDPKKNQRNLRESNAILPCRDTPLFTPNKKFKEEGVKVKGNIWVLTGTA